MSPCAGDGDGPAVLQLQRWDRLLRSQLELSEYSVASLSPSKDLLLLLSHQYEALLIPLVFGKPPSDHLHEANSQGVDTVESPECSGKAEEVTFCPFISNVKSCAWGHCSDAYNQFENSGFRELLVVSGDNEIIVHAYHDRSRNEVYDSVPESGNVHGKWVEWGPKGSTESKEFCGISGTLNSPRAVNDAGSCNRSILPKRWFRTFLTKLDIVVSNGEYLARFPAKSLSPKFAEVVSFDIYSNTLNFLEFQRKNLGDETGIGQVGTLYKCSRVFNSSSHRLLGLVLNFTVNALSGEVSIRDKCQVLVVVMMIHQWGLQWACSIGLQDEYPSARPSPEWVDFQFSEDYLVCLNTSGLICIHGAKTGNLIVRFSVLESSVQGFNFHSGLMKSQLLPVNRDSASTSSQGVDKKNEMHKREACDNEIVHTRTFRRLMVASHSLLLAAVDELGVIYVIWAAKYVSKESDICNKFLHRNRYYDCGMLATWKVAGCKIGGQKMLPDLSPSRHACFSNLSINVSSHEYCTKFTRFRKTERHSNDRETRWDTFPSGFCTSSQVSCQEFSNSEPDITSRPLRNVFLPLEKFRKENSICFSPFGITRLVKSCSLRKQKKCKIVHSSLHVISPVLDDSDLDTCCMSKSSSGQEFTFSGESIGFCFQGYLYLVTEDGLSVILPSVSISSHVFPVDSIRYWQPYTVAGSGSQVKILLGPEEVKVVGMAWQIEVLDRTLLYEGPKEAERICLENGWGLKIARVRWMQLALYYLKSEEIEKSLDMLVDVNLAEEGILHLLFTSVYRIFCKAGDSEVALASRLLTLAASFATKMIRRYGLARHKKEKLLTHFKTDLEISHEQPFWNMRNFDKISSSRRLNEMARFLEVIRNIQSRLSSKSTRLSQEELAGGTGATNAVDETVFQDESYLPLAGMDSVSPELINPSEVQSKGGLSLIASELAFDSTDKLALSPIVSAVSETSSHKFNAHEVGTAERKKTVLLENPRHMISRWGVDSIDLKTIVKDALDSGRLPLAVLQLHLLQQKESASGKDPHDTFSEVSEIGKTIAYDLFLKGESELAVETLLRLGEDLEFSLRQLLFGTVRRSLRKQIAEEMEKHGYLGPHEWYTLEKISFIESLYPSISFWKAFLGRQGYISGATSTSTLQDANNLKLNICLSDNFTIECGDIDGVVLGSWASMSDGSPEVCEDNPQAAYWACAAIWSDAWDQRTVDRVVLDRPFQMAVNVGWESQLEYHMSHGDSEDVCKLLDAIPASLLSEGALEISLNNSHTFPNMSADNKHIDHEIYICASDEIEPVCIDIPGVKIFRSSAVYGCSLWLRALVEQQLAKKHIFLKEYWEDIAEIMALLARAGLINRSKITNVGKSSMSTLDVAVSNMGDEPQNDAEEALHKFVVHYCSQYSLPNLLDLYLDQCDLVLDDKSLSSFLEAAGDCQWAKWSIFLRVKGHEYEASLCNARSNSSRQTFLGSNLNIQEIDEVICTVDDIAEGGGEMTALATLMYAAAPVQKCLCAGSVNRNCSFSSQCTLENLRPGLQHFPTLWRTLVAACFGQDDNTCSLHPGAVTVFGKSVLSDYLIWRDNIFSSAGGDTFLIQMLPCWFPKSIRRLVTLFVQGPLGWQSLSGALPMGDYRETYIINAAGKAVVSPINWEIAIQRSVDELYSSLEEKRFGVEHHLHRGRALAAFNHIVGLRTAKLKPTRQDLSGQNNIQSDIQAILAPVTQSEESLLSSVVPLAIMHFEDSVLAASCAFLLELCGLPANTLRVDLAVLRCISSYYNSIRHNTKHGYVSPRGSAIHAVSHEGDITISLAQTLADNYILYDCLNNPEKKHGSYMKAKQTTHSLLTILQHLEKACLPLAEEAKTCGYWLSSGNGDGYDFRSKQKDASLKWNLVTTFCHIHQLPPSTKYLALLANDNDWVGFLTEAQIGGFSDDVIIEVAAKEFSDPRLRMHVLTVLKSVQSTRKKTVSSTTNGSTLGSNELPATLDSDTMVPLELFGLLAECERQKIPGEALLAKAKDLRWPLLAIIASCFSDVSPLSCLTVWLEITAARETSSIKVNDISSKIANNVEAAVEATNALLPAGSRSLTFHYNRRNPKRRRLMEPALENFAMNSSFEVASMSSSVVLSIAQELNSDERNKMVIEKSNVPIDFNEGLASLSNMIAVLCEQNLFLPLLRAFEMFLPSCSLLPFIRSLQAFSQMRLSEASAHLASFSFRIKEEPFLLHGNVARDGLIKTSWISSTAVKAAEAMLSTCPSAYEKRCLLQLLAAADFGDGGFGSSYFRRLYWKINLAEPCLRKDEDAYLGNETLDDAALLAALVTNGRWEQARNWAKKLESSGASWKGAVHHVTEAQAEAMVVEWKEYLWDVPEERAALWAHCQTLFLRHSFPPLQAGLFFLKHAEAIEKEIPARDLHEMLLLALQWLSGTMTQTPPTYSLHLLREIETRVWLLAVESETQLKVDGDFILPNSVHNISGNRTGIIEQTANIIAKMDTHINATRLRNTERNGAREHNLLHTRHLQYGDSHSSVTIASSSRAKRRSKNYLQIRRPADNIDNNNDSDDNLNSPHNVKGSGEISRNLQMDENVKIEASVSGWEEKVRPAEVERAILSLLEFGQITAAKQLQLKLSPAYVPPELILVDAALKVASLSSSTSNEEISALQLDAEVVSVVQSVSVFSNNHFDLLQVLEALATKCGQGCGHGLCRRIVAVVKTAKILGLTFSEAFEKRPIELLQLLSLKAQDSLEEAKLLVQTHVMSPPSIALILSESFLKGLLAAHRGGYMDSQKEEGPAPLLWRFSDFLKWAELCPSEPEIGHALMRLVMTGQDIPHACEVELLILSHHFYQSSACLDGVDVLVTLAANRVESYVLEGDFSCLARLITGVSNFHALNFILNILIENGQLELLLQKYSTAETGTATTEAVRGFRMAVLTSLKLFNPHDLDAFTTVYQHFDMKHEMAALLESRSTQYVQQWFTSRYRDRMTEDLLEAMRYIIEAAEVYSSIDAGHQTYRACARASLLSLQIRIPDLHWLELSETNARRALVEQSRFQEALIMAEAYDLNQPSEWAPVLWNLMLKPDLIEEFVAEFVAVLPLQPSMLLELARFYRAEVAARGDQSHFSVWLSPGGLPAEWVKHLGRSFRSLLKRTRDLRVRLQLATIATGFGDVIDFCNRVLDRVPETAGPLILRRGHGGAYLPLM